MLKVPDAEIRNMEETMRLLKQKIPLMGTGWTDTGSSDPGITVLELFAFMNMTMQERLGEVTRAHLNKYRRLLGLMMEPGKCSRAVVDIKALDDKPHVLLKGTKLVAGDVVFEADETKIVYDSRIERLYYASGGRLSNISRVLSSINIKDYVFGRDPGAGDAFYIGMTKPFWNTVSHSLYFWVDETAFRRNPFSEEFPFSMSAVRWEYFDGSGWKEAETVKDNTNGFLVSGYVTLGFGTPMERTSLENEPPLYYLRAVLTSADYDIAPRINYMSLSTVNASQRDTVCRTIMLSGTGEDRQTYLIEEALALEETLLVEVRRDNGEWIEYPVGHGPQSRCNIIAVDDTKPFLVFDKNVYGTAPGKGERNIRVTCYKKGFEGERLLSFGTGLINQTYETEFTGVDWGSFRLVTTKPTYYGKRYYEWEKTDDLSDAGEDQRVYQLDMETGMVMFGDGIHGAVPENNETIMIDSLAFSKGIDGNVKENEINRFVSNGMNEFLSAVNHMKSGGGRDAETTEEMIKSFKTLKNRMRRAITREHYRELVMSTPGLAIERAAVWSYDEIHPFENIRAERSKNTVFISVLPYGMYEGRRFLKVYGDAILAYLEKYRLVTTKIRILEPQLAGIEVYGTIYIKEHHIVNEKVFNDRIKAYFDSKKEFGEELVPGEIYASLDGIESVEYIENISLECRLKGCKYGKNGNLILPPNAVCYIKTVMLEFKR